MFAPKAILVPTDFSEYSDRAIKEAVGTALLQPDGTAFPVEANLW